jgi:hypothetical protein
MLEPTNEENVDGAVVGSYPANLLVLWQAVGDQGDVVGRQLNAVAAFDLADDARAVREVGGHL